MLMEETICNIKDDIGTVEASWNLPRKELVQKLENGFYDEGCYSSTMDSQENIPTIQNNRATLEPLNNTTITFNVNSAIEKHKERLMKWKNKRLVFSMPNSPRGSWS